jgi:hypothetical protein
VTATGMIEESAKGLEEEETNEVGLVAMDDGETGVSGSVGWNERRLIPCREFTAVCSLLIDEFIHIQDLPKATITVERGNVSIGNIGTT